MILWSQQLKIINDSFHSFQAGKKVHVPISETTRNQGHTFLRPSIHESMNISNFKIHVLNILYSKQPLNVMELLQELNQKEEKIFDASKTLTKDLKTYRYIINRDSEMLASVVEDSEVIWDEYTNDKIHKFTLHRMFKNNKFKPFNRASKREIQVLNALMCNFNIDYKDN